MRKFEPSIANMAIFDVNICKHNGFSVSNNLKIIVSINFWTPLLQPLCHWRTPTSSLRCYFLSYFHYGNKIKKQRNVICALTNCQRTITLRCFFLFYFHHGSKIKKATQCDSEKIQSLPPWQSQSVFSILTKYASHQRIVQKGSKSHRVRIRQRTNTQSHRFFTISFIPLPYTIVSFGGLLNNKSKWGWLIMQGCQKNRTNLNRNLIRELVRRFFHWYFLSEAACWIVQIVSRESSETWAYAKKCWKIEEFFTLSVEIFNTPRFKRNCREMVLEKNWFKLLFLWKNTLKRRFSRKNVFFNHVIT